MDGGMMRGPVIACLLVFGAGAQGAPVSGQGTWETTLQGRDLDGNLTTVEAWYDTVLRITWLADINHALSTAYDDDGRMTWQDATAWVDSLDPYGSGATGWRLPYAEPVDGSSYKHAYNANIYGGTSDLGYNISAPGTAHAGSLSNELAHMFYNTLGNKSPFNPIFADGTSQPANSGNTGPFVGFDGDINFWSANELPPDFDPPNLSTGPDLAFHFIWEVGYQGSAAKSGNFLNAWAVHSGDVGVSVVPIPATAWLFASALGVVGFSGWRRKQV